ncbi:MAG: FAD-binding oxidoreductase [Actinomycetota bacterium]|nr:FAD-binding oxidoreductase [Actinomycetota bacterium]
MEAPEGPIPLSRGAAERALRRVDLYPRHAEVRAIHRLTPTGTVALDFQVVDDQSFVFRPGHFVGIRAEVDGIGLRRSPYCLASPPNDERTFRLLVREVTEAPMSYYLTGLSPGDAINFRGPSGRSMIPRDGDEDLVYLATGVGIGPLLALVDHLETSRIEKKVSLYWGLRLATDICLIDELDELARRYPSFSYRITLSQPPPGWAGLRGRITESVPPLLGTLGGKRFYLVGNGAMINEMVFALSDLGVDRTLVHEEVYFNVRHRPDPQTLADIRSRFVATDLFSPHSHQEAGLLYPENPISRRRPPSTSMGSDGAPRRPE